MKYCNSSGLKSTYWNKSGILKTSPNKTRGCSVGLYLFWKPHTKAPTARRAAISGPSRWHQDRVSGSFCCFCHSGYKHLLPM